MTAHTISSGAHQAEARASWVPMIAIALGQMIMSFNVASLPVAMGGMVKAFSVPPTTVATGIVAYSMLVAGFVMLGAKLAQRFGAVRVFRGAVPAGFAARRTAEAPLMEVVRGLAGIHAGHRGCVLTIGN